MKSDCENEDLSLQILRRLLICWRSRTDSDFHNDMLFVLYCIFCNYYCYYCH